MLIFIWWWFPRTWNKGNAQERAIIDEQIRQQRERQMALDQMAAQQAAEGGTHDPEAPPVYAATAPPVKPQGYVPPVTPF